MATFISDLVDQMSEKWREIDIMLQEAKKHETSNSELYNALCRSTTVLIVAHLEGFVRDLAKALVGDINYNLEFKDMPSAIKRTYCKKYLSAEKSGESNRKKEKVLIEKFEILGSDISHEPFFYSDNKNPKPSMIDAVFKNFGVRNVFHKLHRSSLDDVFSESDSLILGFIDEQKRYLNEALAVFPYDCQEQRLAFDNPDSPSKNNRTLWETFLDDVNQKRHEVAHGNDADNTESVGLLVSRKQKIEYLELGLLELICGHITKSLNLEPEVD